MNKKIKTIYNLKRTEYIFGNNTVKLFTKISIINIFSLITRFYFDQCVQKGSDVASGTTILLPDGHR